ncbi:hypothetical protein WA158_002265 [Blastocystis sp. Blastoise]
MKAIYLLFFIAAVFSLEHSNAYYRAYYDSFLSKFNKKYTDAEYKYRLSVFAENIDYINAENQKGHSYSLGLTIFTDLTNEEFKNGKFCGCNYDSKLRGDVTVYSKKASVFTPIDWREKNVVNAIRDQGHCGSCWAFSAISSIESANAIKTGNLLELSEQQLVDCVNNAAGCGGGNVDTAFVYYELHSICSRESYPYTATDNACTADSCTKVLPTIKTFSKVTVNSGASLVSALQNQPVSVSIEADKPVFKQYTGGIIDSEECGTSRNHAVVVVGSGEEDGKKYLLVRNSWGTSWGLDGYVKIAYVEEGEGICGINMNAYFPILY